MVIPPVQVTGTLPLSSYIKLFSPLAIPTNAAPIAPLGAPTPTPIIGPLGIIIPTPEPFSLPIMDFFNGSAGFSVPDISATILEMTVPTMVTYIIALALAYMALKFMVGFVMKKVGRPLDSQPIVNVNVPTGQDPQGNVKWKNVQWGEVPRTSSKRSSRKSKGGW